MLLNLQLKLSSMVTQTARLARDAWKLVNDTWRGETRKWSNIT